MKNMKRAIQLIVIICHSIGNSMRAWKTDVFKWLSGNSIIHSLITSVMIDLIVVNEIESKKICKQLIIVLTVSKFMTARVTRQIPPTLCVDNVNHPLLASQLPLYTWRAANCVCFTSVHNVWPGQEKFWQVSLKNDTFISRFETDLNVLVMSSLTSGQTLLLS